VNVDLITCYDNAFSSLPGNSFNYTKNSDFVDYLKKQTAQREWIGSSEILWNGRKTSDFAEIVTKYGISFGFNLVEDNEIYNMNQITNDFRFSSNASIALKERKPWKTGVGSDSGFQAKFTKTSHNWENICRMNGLIVHSPFEPPTHTNRVIKLGLKRDVTVMISLEVYQADDDLRSIPVDQRHCYLDDERKLSYFKVYTKNNCETECLSFVGRFLQDFLTTNHLLKLEIFSRSLSKMQMPPILHHSQ
jgi:hypothetical protein